MQDWTNESDYDFTEFLTPQGWAWQFVRRNPAYRRFWQKNIEAERSSRRTFGFLEESANQLTTGFLWRECIREWGFSPPTDPDLTLPPAEIMVFRERALGPALSPGMLLDLPYLHAELTRGFDLSESSDVLAGIIDLRIAITTQTEAIAKRAFVEQERLSKRPSRSEIPKDKTRWTTYLRALDASLARVKHHKIANVLYPDPGPDIDAIEKIKHTLRQARRLTKPEGYLKFLGLPTAKPR